MSDRDIMAQQYIAFGTNLKGGIIDSLNVNYDYLQNPNIDILYEIDGTKIDMREPKLNVFKAH